MNELQDYLRKIENRKATEPDSINTELLKQGRENLSSRLLNCNNACMRSYKSRSEAGVYPSPAVLDMHVYDVRELKNK